MKNPLKNATSEDQMMESVSLIIAPSTIIDRQSTSCRGPHGVGHRLHDEEDETLREKMRDTLCWSFVAVFSSAACFLVAILLLSNFTGWPFTPACEDQSGNSTAENQTQLTTEDTATQPPSSSWFDTEATRERMLFLAWAQITLMCLTSVPILLAHCSRSPVCIARLLRYAGYLAIFTGFLTFLGLLLWPVAVVNSGCYSRLPLVIGFFVFLYTGISFMYMGARLCSTKGDYDLPQDSGCSSSCACHRHPRSYYGGGHPKLEFLL